MQFQLVEVPFREGVDQKTDAKMVVPTKLLDLENGSFVEGGTIQKRPGFQDLPNDLLGGGQIVAADSLLTFQDELVLVDKGTIYAFSPKLQKWSSRGSVPPVKVENRDIFRNNYQQARNDAASLNGITLVAWEDGRGGVRASAFDDETGTILLGDAAVSATGVLPRVIGLGSFLFVVYLEGGTVTAKRLATSSPTTFSSAFIIAGDATATAADQRIDVHASRNQGTQKAFLFAYNGNAANIKIGYLMEDGNVGGPGAGYASPISVAEAASRSLSLHADLSNGAAYVFYSNAATFRSASRNEDLTQKTAPTTVEALTTVENVTAVQNGTSFDVFYEISAALAINRFVKKAQVLLATLAPSGIAVLKRSVGLGTQAFLRSGVSYAGLAHASTLQPTIFVTSFAGTITAKCLYAQAGGLESRQVPSVIADSSDVFRFPAGKRHRIVTVTEPNAAENVTYSLIGESIETISFGQSTFAAELGKNLHLTGGVASIYDGQQVVEAGFHLFPHDITVVPSITGGSMTAGTYQAAAVFSWDDAKGQRHRSAPSVPITFAIASGTTGSAVLTIPTLRLTGKSNVELEVYTTEVNLTVFYRTPNGAATDPLAAPLYNDSSVDTVAFTRQAADATIISQEILYTQGGILENIGPPAASLIAASKSRVFLVDSETGLVWFSKAFVPDEGAAFSNLFAIRVDPIQGERGDITALAAIDDKTLLFKRDSIYALAGDGPDDAGFGNTFTEPVLVTTDVGAKFPTVGLIPDGVTFFSAKGIYLLTRSLQAVYLGAEVEDVNSGTPAAIVLDDDKNQLRVLMRSGDSPMYDYFFRQWSLFTGHNGVGMVRHAGVLHYALSDGTVRKEDATFFREGTNDVRLKLSTGWVKLAGIQGFQRVRRILLLGKFHTTHTLLAKVFVDYQETDIEQFTFDPAAVLLVTPYGSGLYGAGLYGGVADQVYQLRHHLARQKCQAIRFDFEDTGVSPDKAMSINAMALEIGLIPGGARLKPEKSV